MRNVLLALLLTVISGCSTAMISYDQLTPFSGNTTLGNPVYAHLQQTEGGYVFSEFSTAPDGGPWVNLLTGQPHWSTAKSRCGVGLIKDRHKDVGSCSDVVKEELFLESNFDEKDALVRTLGAAFTMGMTLTGASFDVEFNQEKYAKAYSEAMQRALNQGQVSEAVLAAIDAAIDAGRQELRDYSARYASSVSQNKIRIEINDQSGLLTDVAGLENHVRTHILSIQKNSLPNFAYGFTENSLETIAEKIRASHAEYKQDLSDATSSVVASYRNEKPYNGFNFTTSKPEKFDIVNGTVVGKVGVKVTSKDYYGVVPSYFKADDNFLIVELESGKIGVSNRSKEFVKVQSIAFYYNNKVATLNDLDIDLAPETSMLDKDKINLSRFNLDSSEVNFTNYNYSKAKNTKLLYGFAVKYVLLGTNRQKTIYTTKNYTFTEVAGL